MQVGTVTSVPPTASPYLVLQNEDDAKVFENSDVGNGLDVQDFSQ